MLLLPLVFVVILFRYPAGLLVYWITTNLWTIGQQYLIKRHATSPRRGPAPDPTANRGGRPTASRTRREGGSRGRAGRGRRRQHRQAHGGSIGRTAATAAQEEETLG